MNRNTRTTTNDQPCSAIIRRCTVLALVLVAFVSSGCCSQVRLPAIDPTGSCLFAPKPTTTTFAVPCCNADNCVCLRPFRSLGDKVGGLKDHLHEHVHGLGLKCKDHKCKDPVPAWTDPVDPPACNDSKGLLHHKGNEPCVPSSACSGSCKDGPPAVLLGEQCKVKDCLHLAHKGKRGCILLTPTKVVAPVGGEVVLLSGICGPDGYLQMNEKLEWMLTPESVGTFLQVGDDEPGIVGRLVGSMDRPKKIDPAYAMGITSSKRTLITRGNMNPSDDVQLEKGQTWITISSPAEGTSRVTVLAPESECWDQRKATTTIYWVDARWQFPTPQVVQAGTPVELTTRVTRSEGGLPARGWKVRYEILQPELATFVGTNGASVVEAKVDESGNASVQLQPNPGTSGSAAIDIQVIRPGGELDNIPTITLGRGQAFVTWSSPELALRAGGPAVAGFDTPFQVIANVSNPGNQPLTGVSLSLPVPQGAKVLSANLQAQVLPNAVVWEIGTVPPQSQLDLVVNLSAQSPVDLVFKARGGGMVAEDRVRVDVFRPSLSVKVTPVQSAGSRLVSGDKIAFDIDVTNTGTRVLQNVYLTAAGDDGLVHESGVSPLRTVKNGGLQPGETWEAQVEFATVKAGQRCITVDAYADGGQRDTQQGCVTVINPVPRNPRLQAELAGRNRIAVGQQTLVRAVISNIGRGVATNVKVVMAYSPVVQLEQATEGSDQSRVAQNVISWSIPRLEAEKTATLEGLFKVLSPANGARITLQVTCDEQTSANTDFLYDIVNVVPPPLTAPRTELPPVLSTPVAPNAPTTIAPALPLQGGANSGTPATPPVTATPVPQRTEKLQMRLVAMTNPARVAQPIRFRLTVINDSSERDGQIAMQFRLPAGVRLLSANPITNPEANTFTVNGDVVTLKPIGSMPPGSSAEFQIVLESNQPQTFDFTIQAQSQRMQAGIAQTVRTTVNP